MKNTREDVCLCLTRALLGEIFPALRLVRFELNGPEVIVDFYVDGEISEQDAESVSCVETELIADLDADSAVATRIHCVLAPEEISASERAVTVFRRRE